MSATPYSKSCNATIKKFYDDFDLLPRDVKELLWNQPTAPDFDDLRVAWELASETMNQNGLFQHLHVFEEDRKKVRAETRAQKQQAKRDARRSKWERKYTLRPRYEYRKVDHSTGKHAGLMKAVTDEQAVKMLCSRKQNDEVVLVPARPVVVRHLVGFDKVPVGKPEPIYDEKVFVQQVSKMLHNAGS